jgi:hypothetical protein
MRELLKEFSTPMATVITAAIAGWITYRFNLAQHQIRQAQQNIALDDLRLHTFEHRYKIYKTAIALLDYIFCLSRGKR